MSFMNNTKIRFALKLALSGGLLTYLFFTLDWRQLKALQAELLTTLPLGFIISMGCFVFMAARWRVLVQMQANRFPFPVAYRGYLIGSYFNIFMPGAVGGDLIRTKYCLGACDIGIKKAGLVVITERVFGLAALAILFAIGITIVPEQFAILELGWLSVFIGIAVAFISIMVLIYWLSRHIVIELPSLSLLLILSAAGQMADIVIAYIVLAEINSPVQFVTLLFVMPLVYVATVLPISIGGLGVREGVLSGLLVLFGVEYSTAIITSFFLYLVKVLIGLVGFTVFISVPNKAVFLAK